MAVVVATSTVSVSLLGGIATLIGLAVLVAHFANPTVKRLVSATLVAVALAAVAIYADEFVMVNPCDRHEPWSLMWILLGCMWP